MNILSQIVPGLRDARTPFTVGVLWALAGWIACQLLPASVWQNDEIKAISKQLSAVPTEFLIGIILTIVYMIGVFLEILGRTFRRLVFFGLIAAILIFGIYSVSVITQLLSRIIPLLFLILIVVACAALARKWRSAPDVSYRDALNDTFTGLAEALERRFTGWKRDAQQALETDGEILDDLVRLDLQKFFRSHDAFLSEAVEQLDSGQTYAAAKACGVTVDDVRRQAGSDSDVVPPRIKTIDDLRLYRWRDVHVAPSDLKQILSERLAEDTECRVAFADAVLDYSNLRRILRRRMETADIAFRAGAPELYLEYDRIKAEGEFRKAVGTPLAAVLALAAYKWHLVFNAQNELVVFWWMCGAAVAVAVFVTIAGTEREVKARRLLHAAVADEVFPLKRDDYLSTDVFVFRKVADPPKVQTLRHRATESSRRQLKDWLNTRRKRPHGVPEPSRADAEESAVP
ncbi:hypothetical protein AB0F81_29780 [Actinoplanes sp. NPDC024001]|uniref:hypothetical protein n=1 Tax=Actinoplanes sp. NPDC024001 TaxID=3154598 RepID=UPI003404A1E9